MQHLLQKDSKVFRYGNTVPVAVVWSKNGEEIWSLKKFYCLTCWWKQGGRSIGDERGKGGWGGQMLLTLCTLSWVSIFSILYLYTFCSVLIRRICSPIKYSVLFYLAIISFVCTDSVVILYWEIGCKLLLVMWRLMIGLTWMHLLNKKKKSDKREFWTTQYFCSNLLILLVQLCGIAVGLLGQVLYCSTISSNLINSYVCFAVHLHVCYNNSLTARTD